MLVSNKPLFCFIFSVFAAAISDAQSGDGTRNLQASNELQSITSPSYPLEYPIDIELEWRISARSGYSVRLAFVDFRTEEGYDTITIIDSGVVRDTFSGNKDPFEYFSFSNIITLRFDSDASSTYRGFNITFTEVPSCSMILQASNQTQFITTPLYPMQYRNNMKCQWNITARPGYSVRLDFVDFNTEQDYDTVSIITGSRTAPHIRSGEFLSPTNLEFHSIMNVLVVTFTSDSSNTEKGFKATFTEVESCNLNLRATNETQVITSPFYPKPYPNNLQCEWNVLARPGYLVRLVFDDFQTENIHDKVKIIGSGSGTAIFTLDGDEPTPIEYYSYENLLRVTFASDDTMTEKGFRATFTEIKSVYTVLQASNQTLYLSSPSYPKPYENNLRLEWNVTAGFGLFVRLVFVDFVTERTHDKVEVIGSDNSTYTLSGYLRTPIEFFSYEHAFVKFISDVSVTDRGFNATFAEILEKPSDASEPVIEFNCGGTFQASSQTQFITTPDYPEQYRNDLICEWFLAATPGHFIQLEIVDFETEGNNYDNVTVFVSGNDNYTLSGDLRTPIAFFSSENILKLVFISDFHTTERGFNANFTELTELPSNISDPIIEPSCFLTLQAATENQFLTSPDYPDSYGNSLNCEWNINAQQHRFIRFEIVDFITEEFFDNVTVIGSSSGNYNLSGNLRTPIVFYSSQNFLLIKFKTDVADTKRGFRASFREMAQIPNDTEPVIEINCISSFKASNESQYLTSPNYPQNYRNNLNCRWNITATTPKLFIRLSFVNFNTEDSYDRVQVVGSEPQIYGLSGNLRTPIEYYLFGSSLTVTFTSDFSITRSGFRASFSEVACSLILPAATSNQSTFSSPQYPNSYSNNMYCVWMISTQSPELFIRLVFTKFETESLFDVVEILEIPSRNTLSVLSGSYDEPIELFSTSSIMFITMKSDSSNTRKGFTAIYWETEEIPSNIPSRECGFLAKATNRTQEIASPGFPNQTYANNLICQWNITSQSGLRVLLVIDTMETEESYDFVRINIGTGIIHRLSGTIAPGRRFISINNTLLVTFSTDRSVQESGFLAFFTETDEEPVLGSEDNQMKLIVCHNGTDNHLYIRFSYQDACEFHVNATSQRQVLTSPGFPNENYPSNLNCMWVITARPENHVQLLFTAFNTELIFDVVTIDDGSDNTATLSGIIDLSRRFYSVDQVLNVQFRSDFALEQGGFAFEVTETVENPVLNAEITDGCSFNLAAGNQSNEIRSPNYPFQYSSNLFCRWEISASQLMAVQLTVQHFNTEISHDILTINLGSDEREEISGYRNQPITYTSSGNVAVLEFRSDRSVNRNGFLILYSEANPNTDLAEPNCGGNHTLSSENNTINIATPGYSSNNTSLYCKWIVATLNSCYFFLQIDDFDTDFQTRVQVLVKNGDEITIDKNVIIGTSYYINSSVLDISLRSRSSTYVGRGFSATIETKEKQKFPLVPKISSFVLGSSTVIENQPAVHYMVAEELETWYFLPTFGLHQAESYAEWIVLASQGFHVQFRVLQMECNQCSQALDIVDDLGLLAQIDSSTSQLKPYVSQTNFLRVSMFSDQAVKFEAIFREIDLKNETLPERSRTQPTNSSEIISPGFNCSNGESIFPEHFCDGVPECSDESDERLTTSSCSNCSDEEIACHKKETNQTCIVPRDYVCRNLVTCQNIDYCDAGCSEYYRCKNGSCFAVSTVCNGILNDGCEEDKEWSSGPGFKCIREGSVCSLPPQLVMDGIRDCDQADDFCYELNEEQINTRYHRFAPDSVLKLNRSRCFQCFNSSMVVPIQRVCDGVVDCPDLSDECTCERNSLDICDRIVIRQQSQQDESRRSKRDEARCADGEVQCDKATCVAREAICDSKLDCPDGYDESYELCQGTLQCKDGLASDVGSPCRCDSTSFAVLGTFCDQHPTCPPPEAGYLWEKPPGFAVDECVSTCSSSFQSSNCTDNSTVVVNEIEETIIIPCARKLKVPSSLPESYPAPTVRQSIESSKVCDGVIDCSLDSSDEHNCDENIRFRCIARNAISIPVQKVCNGFKDCDDGSDENEALCPERFYCNSLGGTKVSVPKSFECDLIINCDEAEDERNCDPSTRFYCENEEPLFVPINKMFDGHGDCSDFTDECPTSEEFRQEDIFSSRYELIANPILRALVWIMGLLAIFGNTMVMVVESRNLLECSKPKYQRQTAVMRNNRMLILNLAVADLLMGIYLLILGGAGAFYQGEFCVYRISWLTSGTCSFMGVLVVLSSETSVITLVLLTTTRLYNVTKPFEANDKPKASLILAAIFGSWIIAILFATIPLATQLQSVFVDEAFLGANPFFAGALVDFDSAKNWAAKLMTFDPEFANSSLSTFDEISNARSWYELRDIVQRSSQSGHFFQPDQFLGYYSANSVCIPRLFVTKSDKSWMFSIFVTIFNFISFLFVLCTYAFIIYRVRSRPIPIKNASSMQKKIFRVLATDFCCWFPITLMAMLSIGGVPISNTAYAVSAIILLPINSALNPIVYSNVIDILIRIIRGNKKLKNLFTSVQDSTAAVSKDASGATSNATQHMNLYSLNENSETTAKK